MRDRVGSRIPGSWVLLACIGLIALNMRGPFVAVAPVVGPMQLDLGFTPVELGLLTGSPRTATVTARTATRLRSRSSTPGGRTGPAPLRTTC